MPNTRYNEQVSQEAAEKPEETASPKRYYRPGELMELERREIEEIKKLCKDGVDSWQSSAGTRLSNLRRWNDLLEGVMEEVDFPWEGSSNIHIPLVALHIVTLHSVIARSVLDVDPIWYGKSLDKDIRDSVPDIEEAISYKAKAELNIVSAVRDWIWTTCRDGLGWLQLFWSEESHPCETVVRVKSVEQFQKEYPTPEDAHLSPEAYSEVLEEISQKASVETPYEVPIVYEHVDYRGPKGETVDEADMVRAPYTANSIKNCRVYGKRFYPRIQELKERAEKGELWEDAVEAFAKKSKKTRSGSGLDDSWKTSRDSIEGISNDDNAFSDETEAYELCVRYKSKEEKREVILNCTYSRDKNMLLGVVKYPYTFNCYIPARIMKRPGRMPGVSVPEKLEGISEEVDHSIRHEINSDAIELSPIFKGKKGKVEDFDPNAEENLARPGAWWLFDNPEEFGPLKMGQTNKSDSMERRQELMRVAEMLIGPTQLLSGKESPTDPNAPARKTIALIAQSNMRIEDYMREFRGDPDTGFDGLGNGIVALYEQFGDEDLPFESKDGEIKSISRSVFRKPPRMSMRGVTAVVNPDTEFEKAMQWYTLLRQDPEIANDPVKIRVLLSDLLISGRHPNKASLLPDKEDVKKQKEEMLMKQAEEKVLKSLMQKGVIPPPPVPGAPGGPPPAGIPGPGGPAGIPGIVPGGAPPPPMPAMANGVLSA